mgnify:CR=1 FL=1
MTEEKTDIGELDSVHDDEEEIDVGPFLAYLESDKGHELASRTLKIMPP